jgi:hypothetical protein
MNKTQKLNIGFFIAILGCGGFSAFVAGVSINESEFRYIPYEASLGDGTTWVAYTVDMDSNEFYDLEVTIKTITIDICNISVILLPEGQTVDDAINYIGGITTTIRTQGSNVAQLPDNTPNTYTLDVNIVGGPYDDEYITILIWSGNFDTHEMNYPPMNIDIEVGVSFTITSSNDALFHTYELIAALGSCIFAIFGIIISLRSKDVPIISQNTSPVAQTIMPAQTKFCSKCGSKQALEAKFCESCGAEFK